MVIIFNRQKIHDENVAYLYNYISISKKLICHIQVTTLPLLYIGKYNNFNITHCFILFPILIL